MFFDMEKERGIVLGNAIIAARSAAVFYSNITTRRTWLLQFFRDLLDGDNAQADFGQIVSHVYPNMGTTILDYCSGDISFQTFSSRVFSQESQPFNNDRTYLDSSTMFYSNHLTGDNGNDILNVARIWEYAIEHMALATKNSYHDTDLKIEFERLYDVDTTSGALSNVKFYNDTITTAESVKVIAPFGFLNKAAVFGNTPDSGNMNYNSYLFGSNLLLIDNDVTNYGVLDSFIPPGTDKRHLQRVLNMNVAETERFISNIITVSGGTVKNCPRFGGDKLSPENSKSKHKYRKDRQVDRRSVENDTEDVQFISFDKLNNSIQFTFMTRNPAQYFTANVFILKADDFCTSDLAYRRAALTSLCQCDRPTLAWRVCVLVTPITTTVIDGSLRDKVTMVVLAALTAFRSVYENKKSTTDSRVIVLSGFIGQPLPSYNDKATRPGQDKNKIGQGMLAPLCVFHRWLRVHSDAEWSVISGENAMLRVLEKGGGRAVVVKRPIFMANTDGVSLGASAFVRYMSYEDVVNKMLRLTKDMLVYGLSDSRLDRNCAVAYMRSPNDLVMFKQSDARAKPSASDGENVETETLCVGGTSRLWNALFSAPSYLYVDSNVLTTMGFNAVSVSASGRTFTHVDKNTGDACTVYCSVLMCVVDDSSGVILNDTSAIFASADNAADTSKCHGDSIKVLYNETPYDSRLDAYRTFENRAKDGQSTSVHSRYRENVYDVSACWPGVHVVRIDFVDPELKHIVFAFFTGNKDVQMSLANLHKFSDHCMRKAILPVPILYTIQQEVLNKLYAK